MIQNNLLIFLYTCQCLADSLFKTPKKKCPEVNGCFASDFNGAKISPQILSFPLVLFGNEVACFNFCHH